MKISFARNGNWREKMYRSFILRFSAKADFIQEEDAVADPLDDRYGNRYAYITALTRDTFENGTQMGLRCSFEGTGAPILLLAEDMELDKDGDGRYGACIEVVIWKSGVNVWRYTRQGEQLHYYHAMADFISLEEKEIHDLRVKVMNKTLLIRIDGKYSSVHIPDMPQSFRVGAALCEGVNRLYDLEINEDDAFAGALVWEGETVPAKKIDR